jgi:hypothetical protein
VPAAAEDEHIVIGVDTHKDLHVAVALTAQGGFVDHLSFATTSVGIRQVMRWAADLGAVTAWGIERPAATAPGWPAPCSRPGSGWSRSTTPTEPPAASGIDRRDDADPAGLRSPIALRSAATASEAFIRESME